MTYCVSIKQSAAKSLAGITCADRLRIIEAIDGLSSNPLAGRALKGEFEGLRRLRVGNYRVVCEVVAARVYVLVVRVGHRREIYR